MSKLHFLSRPNKDVYLAFSGGIDSVALLHTLLRKKYNIELLTIDHGNEFAKQEVEFCKKTAQSLGLEYKIFTIPEFDKSTSLEAFWSVHRNGIFQSMDKQVCTDITDDEIEEADATVSNRITYVILQPRIIKSYYGVCVPSSLEEIEYLKKLRNSSKEVLSKLG